jgi:hypothetical protein
MPKRRRIGWTTKRSAEKNGASRDGQAEVEERGARDNTPDAKAETNETEAEMKC